MFDIFALLLFTSVGIYGKQLHYFSIFYNFIKHKHTDFQLSIEIYLWICAWRFQKWYIKRQDKMKNIGQILEEQLPA